MRIEKTLRKDRETIQRFLDVFGGASATLGSSNTHAQPGFFITGGAFIHECLEPVFFRKVDVLLTALEQAGLPADSGTIGAMKNGQEKCRDAANLLVKAATDWQAGDASMRAELIWASSEFTTSLRQNMERLKNLIYPLLDQNISADEEQKILDSLSAIASEYNSQTGGDKHVKLIESLEEEFSEWK